MADYYYSSARIRALESGLIGKDRIARLVETSGSAELVRLLEEYGVDVVLDADSGRMDREATLLGVLGAAYREVKVLTEGSALVRIFLFPYDCNNLKAVIKARIRSIDPAPMLFPFGTLRAEELINAVEKEDFSALPPHMATAARDAIDAYAATQNPQRIDLLLDAACYRDMLCEAERLDNAYARTLVKEKIDLTNLQMTVRVLRMRMGEAGRLLLSESLLEGGTLETAFFLGAYAEGEAYLWERLSFGAYARLSRAVSESDGSLTAVERLCDDAWMETVKTAKMIPSGAEVLVGYLIACEYAVRNVRIVLAGKDAALSVETIRERIRESYV